MKPRDPDRTKVELLDPLLGITIAKRYRIELKIAAGGFGAIYRAIDLETGVDVAVKLLHPQLTSDPAVVERFKREGKALATLRDPHTVSAYALGQTRDGMLYIVMELLEGQTLHDRFHELGPLPWRKMVAIALDVCSALAEAHRLGIVHRDLKPANIHLGEGGTVKVLDFGIAKIIHGGTFEESELTHAGQMIGTFDYMPPEQMVGGECTGQSDIFTLGVVLYEMITGERPFGMPPSAASMLAALLHKTPRSMTELALVPAELDRIVLRCLARTAADRYATVEALAAELDTLVGAQAPGDERTRVHAVVDVALDDAFNGPTLRTPKLSREPTARDPELPGDELTWIDSRPRLPKFNPAKTMPGIGPGHTPGIGPGHTPGHTPGIGPGNTPGIGPGNTPNPKTPPPIPKKKR